MTSFVTRSLPCFASAPKPLGSPRAGASWAPLALGSLYQTHHPDSCLEQEHQNRTYRPPSCVSVSTKFEGSSNGRASQ